MKDALPTLLGRGTAWLLAQLIRPTFEQQVTWSLFVAANMEPPLDVAGPVLRWARYAATAGDKDALEALQRWHALCQCEVCQKTRAGYS